MREPIEASLERLVAYGVREGLLVMEDANLVRNQLIACLQLEDFHPERVTDTWEQLLAADSAIDEILKPLLDAAEEKGLLKVNTLGGRDLFDAQLMGCLMDRPSQINAAFRQAYEQSPQSATDYYYRLSLASNYIRKARTDQNKVWQVDSPFGAMDITINLSKPEKDPKEIEAEKHAVKAAYPKCLLCAENEGYMGRMNHPGRQNHRIIPVTLGGEPWYFQYSPYAYYNEHAIVLSEAHRPMAIEKKSFIRLLDFVKWLPHYFVGSNADLPIVGGSILSHDHFQGGCYEFPMDRAETLIQFEQAGVEAHVLRWPLSVVRLKAPQAEALVPLADEILQSWRSYSDEDHGIMSHTGAIPHNTITPVARYRKGLYELDLVLRNNRCDAAHPDGIFHPHREIHPIKKENIGLIEVMGLAVLPARLDLEIQWMMKWLRGTVLTVEEAQATEKHVPMLEKIQLREGHSKLALLAEDALETVIKKEIGLYFAEGLSHCGVFASTKSGLDGFRRFLEPLKWVEIRKE